MVRLSLDAEFANKNKILPHTSVCEPNRLQTKMFLYLSRPVVDCLEHPSSFLMLFCLPPWMEQEDTSSVSIDTK